MNTFQTFLFTFFLLLVLGSFVIVGFYIITRGERIKRPDGTYFLKGKILKSWSLFWEKTTGIRRMYYQGEELTKKHQWLKDCNAALAMRLNIIPNQSCFQLTGALAAEDYSYLRDVFQCQVEMNETWLFLYEDEPEYYFPEWVRFPLSQCPPCMASVYGSVLYWTLFVIIPLQFNWTLYPGIAAGFFWIIFCISLSALNKLFYNIIGA
jgi:hypothetical protein